MVRMMLISDQISHVILLDISYPNNSHISNEIVSEFEECVSEESNSYQTVFVLSMYLFIMKALVNVKYKS